MDSMHGGSQCMESAANGSESMLVVSAHGNRHGHGTGSHHPPGPLTWWEEWLESGKQPDWDAWKACTLPARSRSENVPNDCDAEGVCCCIRFSSRAFCCVDDPLHCSSCQSLVQLAKGLLLFLAL